MKRILLLLALFTAMGSNCQKTLSKDYEYKVSTPYKVVDADDKYYLSENGKAVKVSFRKRNITVQCFDPVTGNEVNRKEYEDAVAKNTVFERILFIGDKAVIFLTQWDGDNKKEQLYTREVNMSTGELGEMKLLLRIDGKVSGEGSGRVMDFNLTNKFPVYRSFDNGKFLVTYRRIPEKKNDKKSFDKIGMIAFDGNMKELSHREITMPYTERRMDNVDYQLDNNGDLYLLAKVYHDDSNDDKKKKSDEEANFHMEMMVLPAGDSAFKTAKIENKEKFINTIMMYDAPGNGVIAAGFFSNGKGKNYRIKSDGVITFRVGPDAAVTNMNTFDIPVDLINMYESEKTQRKNEKREENGEGAGWFNLRMRNLEIMPDGSFFLAAEQYILVVITTFSQQGSHTTYRYYYNDILAIKADKEGKLQYMKKIPKQQFGTNGRGGMSFEYFHNAKDHFLVFLDNVKNIDLKPDQTPATHTDRKGGYLTAVRIDDQTGEITKGSILNVREIEDYKLDQMSMARMMHTSDDSFMLEAYKKGKEDIMLVVKLK